jgi:lipoprotein NlpD
MTQLIQRFIARGAATVLIGLVAACNSPGYRAPIEERPQGGAASADVKATSSADAAKAAYVVVKAGDTLTRIASETGQTWRDIARWNNIEAPYALQVGQVLRLVAPPGDTASSGAASPAGAASAASGAGGVTGPSVATAKPIPAPRVESKPIEAKPLPPQTAAPGTPASSPSAAVVAGPAVAASTPGVSVPSQTPSSSAAAPPPASASTPANGNAAAKPVDPAAALEGNLQWGWPAAGPIAAKPEDPRNKSIVILGKEGDPISAAAFGRVIHVGPLRRYGNIVIVQHNSGYLSVYGNIRTALVAEKQAVTRGQRIAEMGNSDAERFQLHFEIRKDGEPLDPLKLLPSR